MALPQSCADKNTTYKRCWENAYVQSSKSLLRQTLCYLAHVPVQISRVNANSGRITSPSRNRSNVSTLLGGGSGRYAMFVKLCSTTSATQFWFHIAMKLRAIEQSARRLPDLLAPNGRLVQDEIASAKWLTWHGKGSEAVERIKSIHDMLGETPEHPAYSALWWNLRGTYWYLESNGKYLVNYGWRYRRGMPISSSIAESAVNEVVSLRCARRRQMRWTN